MKRKNIIGLISLSLLWVPVSYSMEALIEKQKEDPVLPIVLVHGLKNDHTSLKKTVALLKQLAPGTEIHTPDIGFYGFAPCEAQIQELTNYMNGLEDIKDGCNLIGYSMGGLIARTAVEDGHLPRVYSLVTLASPHRGVCGFPGSWDDDFDEKAQKYFTIKPLKKVEALASKVLYPLDKLPTPLSSIVDLWNEPSEHETYLKKNKFLPLYNNEKNHKNEGAFRANLSTLAAFLCLAGTKDTTVEPWQSTRWDYCDKNRTKVVPLKESRIYESLGLKDLGDKLSRVTVESTHGQIHENKAIMENEVMPRLTRKSGLEEDVGIIYEETDRALWRRCICCS